MTLDPIQAEYQELWKEYGIEDLPKPRPITTTDSTFVVGTGNQKSKLIFVGEKNESKEEELLTKIIEAMGYSRDAIFIATLLKPSEIEQSLSDLKVQIGNIQPKLVVALGTTATILLSGLDSDLSQMRGKKMKLHWDNKIELIATYPPSYLLINPSAKKIVWEDMKTVQKLLK